MKSLCFLSIIVFLALLSSCKGVSGGEVSADTRSSSSFRSLSLGQVTTTNNRVATTISIDTQESIVILSADPSSPTVADVLYQSASEEVVQLTVDANGQPFSAQTNDTSIEFSDIENGVIALSITSQGRPFPPRPAPVRDEVSDFLSEQGTGGRLYPRILPPDASFQRLFRGAVIAVRTFGCGAVEAADGLDVSDDFRKLASEACASALVDSMRDMVRGGENIEDRLVLGFMGDPGGCSFSRESFGGARDCIRNSDDEVLMEALREAPPLGPVIEGTFDPETGQTIPPPGSGDMTEDGEMQSPPSEDSGGEETEDPPTDPNQPPPPPPEPLPPAPTPGQPVVP